MRELIEQITCDKCGEKSADKLFASFSVPLKRQADAAGGTETVSIDFDLCGKCQTSILAFLLKEYAWEDGTESYIRNLVPKASVA